jgi:hypothetical protein
LFATKINKKTRSEISAEKNENENVLQQKSIFCTTDSFAQVLQVGQVKQLRRWLFCTPPHPPMSTMQRESILSTASPRWMAAQVLARTRRWGKHEQGLLASPFLTGEKKKRQLLKPSGRLILKCRT